MYKQCACNYYRGSRPKALSNITPTIHCKLSYNHLGYCLKASTFHTVIPRLEAYTAPLKSNEKTNAHEPAISRVNANLRIRIWSIYRPKGICLAHDKSIMCWSLLCSDRYCPDNHACTSHSSTHTTTTRTNGTTEQYMKTPSIPPHLC